MWNTWLCRLQRLQRFSGKRFTLFTRNFLSIALSLVLGFFGAIILSHSPSGLTTPSDVEMGKVASVISLTVTDSNAVEKDGIRFEILMPERMLTIPANQPEVNTPVKLGFQITNMKPSPIRINWLDSVSPSIVGADGTRLKKHFARDIFIVETKQSSCPLVMPGKSVSLFMENMVLYWQNGLLKFGSGTGYSGSWYFEGLKPGTSSLGLSYYNRDTKNLCIDPANPEVKAAKEFWTGSIATPFGEFRLIQG